MKGKDHFGGTVVDERILLKLFPKKQGVEWILLAQDSIKYRTDFGYERDSNMNMYVFRNRKQKTFAK
jgi:hypothetical protein